MRWLLLALLLTGCMPNAIIYHIVHAGQESHPEPVLR
jgi:hypothetical protein